MGRTKKEVLTDELLKKGHAHKLSKAAPQVCPECKGWGKERIDIDKHLFRYEECKACGGGGVVITEEKE